MPVDQQQIFYQIALTKVVNIGPVLAKNLISYCGSAEAVFKENKKNLEKIPQIGKSKAQDILNADTLSLAEKEVNHTIKNNIRILSYLDADYPRRLKHFDSSPIILYYKGKGELNNHRTVGIIGTRTPTESGKLITEKLVDGLSKYDVHIVSGLAYGVDGIAHRKSVDVQIPTFGVLGHGLDTIYPQEHESLSKKMMEQGGVLTEFGFGSLPDKQNFPMRNRIIAAMSDALIVVESKVKGGSIITAEFANDFNKDVFAVPGKPQDECSQGCNALIKKNKAHLLENVEDLAYIMQWDALDARKVIQPSLFVELTDEELAVLKKIQESKDTTIDELSYQCQQSPSSLASILLNLEFKGMIRSLPGKRYMKT